MVAIWLRSRTVSSSVQILSENRTTSAAILPSSICASAQQLLYLLRQASAGILSTICGYRVSIEYIFVHMPSNLSSRSAFKASPSLLSGLYKLLAGTFHGLFQLLPRSPPRRCPYLPSSAPPDICPDVDTRISFSQAKGLLPSSRKYFRYSAAISSLYFKAHLSLAIILIGDKYIQPCRAAHTAFAVRRGSLPQKISSFFGILMLTSK